MLLEKKEKKKTSLLQFNQRAHPLHSLNRFLQPIQAFPLLAISFLEQRNALLQLCSRLALLRNHLVGLAEQLRGEFFQLRVRLRQLRFRLLAECLFASQCGLQLDIPWYVLGDWRRDESLLVVRVCGC